MGDILEDFAHTVCLFHVQRKTHSKVSDGICTPLCPFPTSIHFEIMGLHALMFPKRCLWILERFNAHPFVLHAAFCLLCSFVCPYYFRSQDLKAS